MLDAQVILEASFFSKKISTMPIGTSTVDPKDRPVIIVAEPSEINQLALRLVGNQFYGYYNGIFNISQALVGAVNATPEERFLVVLEKLLDLKHRIYWYEPSKAKRQFKFDVGYTPKDGDILVQHPIDRDLYISPAHYSRRVSREKEAAFRQIAAALGAKELRLVSAEIKEKRFFWGGSLSLKEAATQVGIHADLDQSGSLIKSVYSRFGKPDFLPKVPPDLQQWVESDPDLKTMVRGRIEANLEYDRVTLEFSERIGIGGEIAAKIASQGLTFGGKNERVFHSVWYYEVEYWPKD
ncbi:MAG: hypothetical protein AB4050_19140 [Synechococcus sp.]